MNNPSRIERSVMRRVHVIHGMRAVFSLRILAAGVFALALWGIGKEVWVARVLENMPRSGDVAAILRFFVSAFEHTHLLVQMLTILTMLCALYLARETARTLTNIMAPARV